MSSAFAFSDLPLATRVEVAHAAGMPLVFTGAALEELHYTMVAAREVERAFSERSIAVAETHARAELDAVLNRAWAQASFAAAGLSLTFQLGGLLS